MYLHGIIDKKTYCYLFDGDQLQKIRYDWQRFSATPEIQKQYAVEVKNRFEVLEEDSNGGTRSLWLRTK